MNLRESMIMAAEQAPLGEAGVDVDRVLAHERRAITRRRAGIGMTALVAALSVTLAVPALLGGRDHAVRPPAAGGPPPAVTAGPTGPSAEAPVLLRAADFTEAGGLRNPTGSGGIMRVTLRFLTGAAAPAGDPCVLAPGEVAGQGRAPVPEDRCTRVERGGRTVWIRRLGQSAQRPSLAPGAIVVEGSVRMSDGRVFLLGIANVDTWTDTQRPTGPAFDIADPELADIVLRLADRR